MIRGKLRPRRWALIVPCAAHGAPVGKHCAGKTDCLARKVAALEEQKARAAAARAELLRRFHEGG